jgi:hypothetical protein
MDWRRRLAVLSLCGAPLFAGVAFAETSGDAMSPEQKEYAREQQEAEAKFLTSLVGDAAPKARVRACFERVYDSAHLKAHPHQKVLEIRISVHYDPVVKPATENAPAGSHWGYAIRTRLRDGKPKTFLDDGSCSGGVVTKDEPRGPSFKVRCNAACDAGDDLYVDNDGKKALLSNKLDLVHPELDGPGADPKQQAKLDDSLFRLYRASDAECAFDKP